MKRYYIILFFLSIAFLLDSCGINSYVMLKSGKDDVITDSIPIITNEAYRLAPNDKFSLLIYVEDGARIIDISAGVYTDGSGGSNMTRTNNSLSYLVRNDGTAELPILGLVEVGGLTIIETQEKLKSLYGEKYINPFIQIEVVNKRVIVFPGSGGTARVIPLSNENTTLMEVLAQAGGITERGKAKSIKIMRNTKEGRQVYLVDLSTIDGLVYADMVMQANDYVYVEPTKRIAREFLKEVTPIVSLLSAAVTIFALIIKFK